MTAPAGDRPERVHVLLLTYGEPPRARWADQYTYSLLILQRLTLKVAPIPRFLLPLIAARRARIRSKMWREEDYSSPLEPITHGQAELLTQRLKEVRDGREYHIRVIFEFRRPLLPEILDEMAKDEPDHVLLIPLYLADSDFTSGICQTDVATWRKRHGGNVPFEPELVSGFSEEEKVVELMERFVLEQLNEAGWSEEDCREAGLILGAHGTVLEPPPGIDGGLGTTQCFCQRLRDRLAPRFAHFSQGWLNHALGGEWTQPELEAAGKDMAERGIKRLVYFPYGFLADNAESQLEGRMILREFDLEVLHLPCLNTWPPFIDHLAHRVTQRLAGAPEPAELAASGVR